jgi:hypothetical protein
MMKLQKSILKNDIIKWPKSTQVNLQNLWPGSWDQDNFLENKQKKS